MVTNHDAGDVKGLEEVFHSQEISRASGGSGGEWGTTSPEGRDDALLRRRLGVVSSALRDLHREDAGARDALSRAVAPTTELDATLMPEHHPEAGSSGDGAALGAHEAAVSAEPPWKRLGGRYWTVAALSAIVALVVAGVTAGSGHHGSSNRPAQGEHASAKPHGRTGTPGTPSTGPAAPGSLTGGIEGGALALRPPAAGARGSGNEPVGRVTLIGAATTTGTLPAPSGSSPGSGSSGASPGSGGGNPVAPVAAGVGSTVGTSVSGLANQLGTTLPATAPATNAVTNGVSGVLDSVDQAVSATTL